MAKPVDLAFVFALDEELRASETLERYNCDTSEDDDSGDRFYGFSIANTSLICVASCVHDMGPTQTAAHIAVLLRNYRPRYIVLIGIAAAISDDARLGDVVVGKSCLDYLSNAKATDSDVSESFHLAAAPETYRADRRLLKSLQHLVSAQGKEFTNWQSATAERLQRIVPDVERAEWLKRNWIRQQSQVLFGVVASGPVVVASDALKTFVKTLHRKTLALEMESAGAYAAIEASGCQASLITVRGLSDYADKRKTEFDAVGLGAFRTLALQNAFDFVELAARENAFTGDTKSARVRGFATVIVLVLVTIALLWSWFNESRSERWEFIGSEFPRIESRLPTQSSLPDINFDKLNRDVTFHAINQTGQNLTLVAYDCSEHFDLVAKGEPEQAQWTTIPLEPQSPEYFDKFGEGAFMFWVVDEHRYSYFLGWKWVSASQNKELSIDNVSPAGVECGFRNSYSSH